MGTTSQQVLTGISCQVNTGEMLAIMGASGSGKSTVMNIIGLLDRPSSGSCAINGKVINQLDDDELAKLRNQYIGFVFQQFYLLSKLDAKHNVMLPLLYRGITESMAAAQAEKYLTKVGMQDRMHHKPNELSGGQQQRVAIARALVGEPAIILADEPTGALDSNTGKDVMNILQDLHQQEQRTIILVTHDKYIGRQCQRIIKLQDGKIIKGNA